MFGELSVAARELQVTQSRMRSVAEPVAFSGGGEVGPSACRRRSAQDISRQSDFA